MQEKAINLSSKKYVASRLLFHGFIILFALLLISLQEAKAGKPKTSSRDGGNAKTVHRETDSYSKNAARRKSRAPRKLPSKPEKKIIKSKPVAAKLKTGESKKRKISKGKLNAATVTHPMKRRPRKTLRTVGASIDSQSELEPVAAESSLSAALLVAPEEEGAFICLVRGCIEEGKHVAYKKVADLWEHIKKKHIIEQYFADARGDISKAQIILWHQNNIVCNKGHVEKFRSLGELGRHVIEVHKEEIDFWPYNHFWNVALTQLMMGMQMRLIGEGTEGIEYKCEVQGCGYKKPYLNDQALYFDVYHHSNEHKKKADKKTPNIEGNTSILQASSAGKRVQTRNLLGYPCPDHPDKRIGSPEGVWKHWTQNGVHLGGGFWCCIRQCRVRTAFSNADEWYEHISDESLHAHIPPLGVDQSEPDTDTYGWLSKENVFPFVETDLSTLSPEGGAKMESAVEEGSGIGGSHMDSSSSSGSSSETGSNDGDDELSMDES